MVRPSGIWKYFDYVNDRIATCKTCKGSFSHSSSSTNLRKHLASKHPEIDLYQTRKYTKPVKYEIGIHRQGTSKINMTKRKSFIWRHYRVLNHSIAICKVCQKRISYKTSISNLKKHIVKRHPLVDLRESAQLDSATNPNSPDMDMEDMFDEDDDSFPDDMEDVKALLGLTGAQVEKTIEIIEELDNGNHHIIYNGDTNSNSHDFENSEEINGDDNDSDYIGESFFDNNTDHYTDNKYSNGFTDNYQETEEDPNGYSDHYKDNSNHSYRDFCSNLKNQVKLEIKTPAKPALKKCLESVMKRVEAESPAVVEPPKDPIDILVENIGNKLRQMADKQLLIAEVKIHEILYLGENERLKHPNGMHINS